MPIGVLSSYLFLVGSFGEIHNIYAHNLLNVLITSSSIFLPVMFFSLIRVFI